MKKILISFLSVMLIFTLTFSVNAFASIYTLENLPYEIDKKPQQEMELFDDIKEEIMKKLLESEYPDCNPDDIVIRYYGTLSNGAMLINHYNKNYEYKEYSYPDSYSKEMKFANLWFAQHIQNDKDRVILYLDGGFYTFNEAYDLKLINACQLWEIFNKVDSVFFRIDNYPDHREKGYTLFGDVNGDRYVTILDATMIQQYLSGLCDLNEAAMECADFNADGTIDVTDVTLIQACLIRGEVR